MVAELEASLVDVCFSTRRKVVSEFSRTRIQLNHGVDSVPDRLLEGVDTVFHLANVAHTNLSLNENYLYEQVNVKGTRDLLDAAIRSKVSKFIYVSSIKAGGQPKDLYGITKQRAEQLVLSYGIKHGLHVVVLRPSLVYGVRVKGNLYSLISGIVERRLPWRWVRLPEFGNVRSMVSVQDVVSAMLLSASDRAANGKIYILSDGEPYTPCSLQNSVYEAAGLKLPSWVIPRWVFSVSAIAGQVVQNVTGIAMPYNYSVYEKLSSAAEFDASDIRSELGWQPKYNFYSQLPSMIDGLLL